jgi:hypothetical protein
MGRVKEASVADMARMIEEAKDSLAWDAMTGTTVPISEFQEKDLDVLRDFLVDMCSATLPERPPSQEDWDQIRNRAKAAAVEHSLLNRDEKKTTKKPGSIGESKVAIGTPRRCGKSSLASHLMTASMQSPISGRSANLIIVDDPIMDAKGLDGSTAYSFDQLTS